MDAKGLVAKGPPTQPSWLLIVKIVSIVLALGVFVAACYNLSLFEDARGSYYGRRVAAAYSGPGGLCIFAAIWHWITCGLDIGLGMAVQHVYFRILFFIFYILDIIFWLSAWAYSADVASAQLEYSSGYENPYGESLAAMAALGAVEWVLIIVVFVFYLLACLKSPGSDAPNNAELGNVKHDASTSQPYASPQPQQQYPQYGQPAAGYPQQQPGYAAQ